MTELPQQPRPSLMSLDPSSLLARVIHALVQSSENAEVLNMGPLGAAIQLDMKTTLLLHVWDPSRSSEFKEWIKQTAQEPRRGRLVLGFLGGGDDARQVLKKAVPWFTRVPVSQVHVSDQGEFWSKNATTKIRKAFSRIESTPPSNEDWAALVERSTTSMTHFAEQTLEAMEFSTLIQSRRPIATRILAGLILAVFALEFIWGGTQSAPVLLSMGALSPDHVLKGEIWRLFSCTFLHSGPMHVFFNTYVLLVLGSSLERVFGTWRFLLLYGLSCLAGSLASLTFLEGFSVGASGGLWGLLTAEAVLAWRPQGLLPKALISGARKAAGFNLVLNLLNSFRPHVDMWAHFGGGAVGAVLLLSGLLARGVPRLGELEEKSSEEATPENAVLIDAPWIKAAALAMSAVLVGGLVLAFAVGRPWSLGEPVEVQATAVPHLGYSMSLPAGLEQTPGPLDQPPTVNVGHLLSNLGAVVVTTYAGDFTDPAVLEQEHAALVEALEEVPQGARRVAGPKEISIQGRRGVTVRYRYEGQFEEEMAFVFFADAIVKADTLHWQAFKRALPQDYAVQVLESLEPL